ncbi:MAG: type II toxin-antitoxin system VapC family toxin [Blastocatellia bacterium]
MSNLVTDTHAAIWYFAKAPELSATARAAINNAVQQNAVIFLPTISIVEMVYLIEKGKLAAATLPRLMQALSDPASSFVPIELTTAIAQTLPQIPRSTVPDMPDRIIAATALHLNLPLVTADHQIQASGIQTIW